MGRVFDKFISMNNFFAGIVQKGRGILEAIDPYRKIPGRLSTALTRGAKALSGLRMKPVLAGRIFFNEGLEKEFIDEYKMAHGLKGALNNCTASRSHARRIPGNQPLPTPKTPGPKAPRGGRKKLIGVGLAGFEHSCKAGALPKVTLHFALPAWCNYP